MILKQYICFKTQLNLFIYWNVYRSAGTASNLLKVGTKRRRTKQEVKDAKAVENLK